MSSTPETEKDNWWRFGDPLDSEDKNEIEFDPDVDTSIEDDYSEEDQM